MRVFLFNTLSGITREIQIPETATLKEALEIGRINDHNYWFEVYCPVCCKWNMFKKQHMMLPVNRFSDRTRQNKVILRYTIT